MDIAVATASMIDRVLQMRQDQTLQAVQIAVLRQTLDTQAATSAALLESVSGDLPLATEGMVGTRVNTRA